MKAFKYQKTTVLLVLGTAAASSQATVIADDPFLFGSSGQYAASPTNDGTLDGSGAGGQNPSVTGFSTPWVRTDGGSTPSAWQAHEKGLTSPFQGGESGGSVRYQPSIRPGDANGDFMVNAVDLNVVALNWGKNVTGSEFGDFNDDGVVNAVDLNLLALNWHMGIEPSNVFRSLDSPVDEETVYMSMLLQMEEPDNDFVGDVTVGFTTDSTDQDDDSLGQNAGFRVGFAGDGNEIDLIYRSPSGNPVGITDEVLVNGIEFGRTYLVVVKGERDETDSSDKISIWVDPVDGFSETTAGPPDAVIEDFSLAVDSIRGLFFEGDGITAPTYFDELKIGTDWEDVVLREPIIIEAIPEPITALMGLMGLAALGAATKRRRAI